MAIFTNETAVREKFQLADTTLVPTALVTRNIDDAHTVVLRHLDPAFDVPTPDAALVLGETLLAGAYLMRSLASASAFARKDVSIGGQRVESSRRFEALTERADEAEQEAWQALEPFLFARHADTAVAATDTQPIVKEG